MVGIDSPIEIMNSSLNSTLGNPEVIVNLQGLTAKIHILTLIVAGLYIYFLVMRWWTIKKTEKVMNQMHRDITNLTKLIEKTHKKPRKKKK